MRDIVIIGAGNLGREVAQLIYEINLEKKQWNLLGFVDETPEKLGTLINNHIVLGKPDWFERKPPKSVWAVYAIGNPRDKSHLINKFADYQINHANLIHPSVKINEFVQMGFGNIVCANSFVSVNTRIGNYVVISPGCGIGHDTVIEDYATLYWNVTLSGNVQICTGCEIGSKAVVIPKKIVGEWSVIGAGAVIISDIPGKCTAVGVPAKPIKMID